jgi:2-polyprenyl-6-methoxyphenol hydroxylase-like FAD-dependent oxidoreductase
MDKLNKIHGNCLAKKTLGFKGDSTFLTTRMIPIEQDKSKINSNEPRYKTTLFYSYPSELDNTVSKVDDNDPASVIEHVKQIIRTTRPECEVTDILLELWDFVPKKTPDDPEEFPFRTYNPVQRRKVRDVNPLSVKPWTNSRVTLLGDAAHAMSSILALGGNNAIQDAESLSQALLKPTENYVSCVKEYENEMIKRASADLLKSRYAVLKQSIPVGYFGILIRNSAFKLINFLLNIYTFIIDNFIFKN